MRLDKFLADAGFGVTRITEPFGDRYFSANLYFLHGRDRDLLVDADMGIVPLRPVLPLSGPGACDAYPCRSCRRAARI